MSDAYHQLLDATIEHLRSLKNRGVRFVALSPESLARLNAPVRRQSRGVAPSPRGPVERNEPSARPVTTPKGEPGTRTSPPQVAPKPVIPVETFAGKPVLSRAEKEAAFAELRSRVLSCRKCAALAAARKNVVFGVGNIDAELMFVGEAPGADEDQAGEPFVGRAGQLLTKMIQAMGLSRETVYIANILKCRPDTPGQSTGNRKPTLEEMHTCIPYLHEQIDLIRPKVLVALGATAVEGLLGAVGSMNKLRGSWRTYRGIPLMPTFHPAYLLRNQSNAEKRKVWEDMLQVMERLGMAISEKQRNYFLKAM